MRNRSELLMFSGIEVGLSLFRLNSLDWTFITLKYGFG